MVFAARTTEVPNFGKKAVTVGGKEVLLVNVKGQFFACDNECPHQGTPLIGALVKDGVITCQRHGFRFDLKSGECHDIPSLTLKVYPTEVRGDEVFVDLS